MHTFSACNLVSDLVERKKEVVYLFSGIRAPQSLHSSSDSEIKTSSFTEWLIILYLLCSTRPLLMRYWHRQWTNKWSIVLTSTKMRYRGNNTFRDLVRLLRLDSLNAQWSAHEVVGVYFCSTTLSDLHILRHEIQQMAKVLQQASWTMENYNWFIVFNQKEGHA